VPESLHWTAAVPACNNADLPPLVLAVIVADMGMAEGGKTLHSSPEELAGSQQAGSHDMMRLSP
jgi:hypothetical protein